MVDQTIGEAVQDENTIVPQGDVLSQQEYRKWLGRIQFALKYHKKEVVPKYKIAIKRYSSEIGYASKRSKASHNDINLLHKDVRDFIGSVYFRNPEVDFSCRNEENREQVTSIENLEQAVNDEVKDNRELKRTVRSMMVDESLAGLGALFVDYEYDDEEGVDENGNPILIPITNKVRVDKIRPENLIRPPYQQLYNYKSGPYLGYCEIVSLEDLQQDQSLNQNVVIKLKGREYKSLMDKELSTYNGESQSSDALFVKVYNVFIRVGKTMKRLVMADDASADFEPLAYDVWDKGHGIDGDGFPIHVFALNEPAEGFVPPSEAWMLENLLEIIDYLFKKLNKHLKKANTRTFVKTGVGGMLKDELNKVIKSKDQEFIGVDKLPPEIPLSSIIQQIIDQPLGADHDAMLAFCKTMFDQLSRQPSFTQSAVINKDKTAAETQAIQSQDTTINGDYIDKIRDFWVDVFIDWGKLLQMNMQDERNVSIERGITGESEPRQITQDSIQGEFNVDVNVQSFLPPNKEVKRMIAKEAMMDLMAMQGQIETAGYATNIKKLVEQYADNIEMRNADELLIPLPVRTIDQQLVDFVFKKIPFNPKELGGDRFRAFNRAMEILADDQLIAVYNSVNEVTEEELAKYIAFLADSLGIQQAKAPSGSEATTDVGMNAGVQNG